MPISYDNARARIERLLDPTPLPDRQWVFMHSLYELAPHATPDEKVTLFLRATTPNHDDALRFFEPLDDAILAAITTRRPRVTGERLADMHQVIMALVCVVAAGRAKQEVAPYWEPFLARDLTLYDRYDFRLTREALRAIAPTRRRALVLDALKQREVLALHVLDTVDGDDEVWSAALSLIASVDREHEHRPSAAQGLARAGTAIVPTLLDVLAQPKPGVALEATVLNALALIGDPSSAQALVTATGRSAAVVAGAATRALAALGEAARPAVAAGAKSKKKAVRESCGWLLRLLDAPEAAELRRARDAHEALSDETRGRLATALGGDPMTLRATVAEAGIGGLVALIDLASDERARGQVPGVEAFAGDPMLPWALAWVLATRPLHAPHFGAVAHALVATGAGAKAPVALLWERPEPIRTHSIPWELRPA